MTSRLFLIERFWPGVTRALADAAVGRLGRTARHFSTQGAPVRHLQSSLLLQDEVVVSMIEATSRESVIAVTEGARYPADRISESVLVGGRPR